MKFEFKEIPLDQRKRESAKVFGNKKNEGRIPVIVEINKDHYFKTSFDLKKTKYLIPGSCTLGHLNNVIRSKIELDKSKAMLTFVENSKGGIMVPVSELMSTIYKQYADEDGFLYIYIDFENTFG